MMLLNYGDLDVVLRAQRDLEVITESKWPLSYGI